MGAVRNLNELYPLCCSSVPFAHASNDIKLEAILRFLADNAIRPCTLPRTVGLSDVLHAPTSRRGRQTGT